MSIYLWLDDERKPPSFSDSRIPWTWAKTADEAIEYLKTGEVTFTSLDHDLADEHYYECSHAHQEAGCGIAFASLRVLIARKVQSILAGAYHCGSYLIAAGEMQSRSPRNGADLSVGKLLTRREGRVQTPLLVRGGWDDSRCSRPQQKTKSCAVYSGTSE
jgi:hypothetical protein